MEEETVRQHAESHGRATVAGDLKGAGSDLDRSAYGAAGEVMKKMPGQLSGSEITAMRAEGDEWVVSILYRGDDRSATVESRWAERDGVPKIVDLKVV